MKGMVFQELISMMETNFGEDFSDKIIDELNLKSNGAYTSVGTYDHGEILQIVTLLSEKTGTDARDLVKAFGSHLLKVFFDGHPDYFKVNNASDFLSSVDQYIHREVKKLYPDAELPEIQFKMGKGDEVVIHYTSKRPFADLAEGLIEQTFSHFKEEVQIETSDIEDKHNRTFTITRAS